MALLNDPAGGWGYLCYSENRNVLTSSTALKSWFFNFSQNYLSLAVFCFTNKITQLSED